MDDKAGLGPIDHRDPLYWAGHRADKHDDRRDRVQSADIDTATLDVFVEALALMLGRNADYGPNNIAHAYPDPITALVVRMTDKLERIKHLLSKGTNNVYGERFRDSWMDLCCYAAIGVMCQDRTWPNLPPLSNQPTTTSYDND